MFDDCKVIFGVASAMHPQRSTLLATPNITLQSSNIHPQRVALQVNEPIHPQRIALQTSSKSHRGFARPMVPVKSHSQPVVTLPMPVAMMDPKLMEPPTATKKSRCRTKKMIASREVCLRSSAGVTWVDNTLDEWPKDDFRIFVGDLGNEVSDATLSAAFSKYSSFRMAKVIRDNRNGKTKGFGFVSLMDASEYLRALKEMDRKYVGSQPIRVKGSKWKKRQSKAFTNPMTIDKRRKKRKIKGSLKHLSGFDKSERTVKPF